MHLDIVKPVVKKARDSLGHPFDVIVVPGSLGTEMSAELARHGRSVFNDGGLAVEMNGRQIDAATAFWKAVGVKKYGKTQFHFGLVNEKGEVDKSLE